MEEKNNQSKKICHYLNCIRKEFDPKDMVLVQIIKNYQFQDTLNYCSEKCLDLDRHKKYEADTDKHIETMRKF